MATLNVKIAVEYRRRAYQECMCHGLGSSNSVLESVRYVQFLEINVPLWIVKLAFSHKHRRRPKDIMEFGYLHGSSNIDSEFS